MKAVRKIILGVFTFYSFLGVSISVSQGQKKIDSLEKLLAKSKQDTNKVLLLSKISFEYVPVNPEKAYSYAKEETKLSKQLGYSRGLPSSYYNLGSAYKELVDGNLDTAIHYFDECIKCSRQMDNKRSEALAWGKKATCLRRKGDFPAAINSFQNALKILEKTKDSLVMANQFNGLGGCYYVSGDYKKARTYYRMAASIFAKKMPNSGNVAVVYNNIGSTFLQSKSIAKNDYDSVIYFAKMALPIAQMNGNKAIEASAYGNLATALSFKDDKDYQVILNYFFLAIKIEETNHMSSVLKNYQNVGIFYGKIGDYKNAEKYLIKCIEKCKEINALENESIATEYLAKICYKQNKTKEAYDYLSRYILLEDSILNTERLTLIEDMEAKYQNEKKQREIIVLQKDNEIKELNIKRNKTQNVILITFIVVIIIGTFLFFQWYKLKQRQKMDAEMLKQQELRLSAIIEAQEEERKRISKDLHDGVGQLLTSLKLNIQSIMNDTFDAKVIKEKLSVLSSISNEAATEVRNISHQMMPRVLSELGLVVALEDMLNKAFRNRNVKYEFEHSSITERFNEKIEIGLYRIAQELVNNILKHAEASEINLQLFKNKSHLIMIVEDNGTGFEFNGDKKSGHGLMNIITRAKSVNGNVNYDRGPEKGMVATIRIPLYE